MINKGLEEFIKDEVKAFEERLRAKAEELQEQFDNNDNPKTIWDLDVKDRDKYYCLYSHGYISSNIFEGISGECTRDMGNAFLTREEAEFERERRKIEAVMKKYSRPFTKKERNYCIYYNYDFDRVVIDVYYSVSDGVPYFESEKIALKVIDEIGEDRLKKYWFGVIE